MKVKIVRRMVVQLSLDELNLIVTALREYEPISGINSQRTGAMLDSLVNGASQTWGQS